MSECVVKMGNPDDCLKCGVRHICNPYVDYWQQDTRKKPKPGQKGCLIICSLPEGHGRLVSEKDVRWAIDDIVIEIAKRIGHVLMTKNETMEYVNQLPTIVPTERSDE